MVINSKTVQKSLYRKLAIYFSSFLQSPEFLFSLPLVIPDNSDILLNVCLILQNMKLC